MPQLRNEREYFDVPASFNKIIDQVRGGEFGWSEFFNPVMDAVCGGSDYYLLANDFEDYLRAQEDVDRAYKDQVGAV